MRMVTAFVVALVLGTVSSTLAQEQVASLSEMVTKVAIENSDAITVTKEVTATTMSSVAGKEIDRPATLERRAHRASQIALVVGGTLDGVTTFRGLTPYSVSFDRCWADGTCSHATSTSVWHEGGFGIRNIINPHSRGQVITSLIIGDSLALGLSELAYRKGGGRLRAVAIVANTLIAAMHTQAAIQNHVALSAYRQAQVPPGAFNISW